MADFGDVRSILQQQPNAQVWKDLCNLMDDFPVDVLQHRVLPYVEGHLRNWPAYLKIAPKHWLHMYLADKPTPQMSLIRVLKTNNLNQEELGKLALCDAFGDLESLFLQNCYFSPEMLTALLNAPMTKHLKTLYLAHSHLGDNEIEKIIKIKQLSRLETLDLRYNRLSDKSAELLAKCEHFETLKTLDLRYNNIGIDGSTLLVKSNNMPGLHKLDLQSNPLSDDEILALLTMPRFRRLATVELVRYDLDPETATDIVERDIQDFAQMRPSSVVWSKLCKLLDKVPNRHLNDAFLKWINEQFDSWPDTLRMLPAKWKKIHSGELLGQNPRLAVVRFLDFSETSYSSVTFLSLMTSPYIQNITGLNVYGCRLGYENFQMLVTSRITRNLRHLNIGLNQLRGQEVVQLFKQEWVRNLQSLALDYNYIGNRCLGVLFEVPFHDLKRLSLINVGLNRDSVKLLVNCQYLGNLDYLNVLGNRLNATSRQMMLDSDNLPEVVKTEKYIF